MSIKSQLAKIVKTLTGSDSTAKTTSGVLGEINDAVSNGSGSASAPFVVEVTLTIEDEGGYQSYHAESNAISSNLTDALNSGKTMFVELISPVSNGSLIALNNVTPLTTEESDGEDEIMVYTFIGIADSSLFQVDIDVDITNGDQPVGCQFMHSRLAFNDNNGQSTPI